MLVVCSGCPSPRSQAGQRMAGQHHPAGGHWAGPEGDLGVPAALLGSQLTIRPSTAGIKITLSNAILSHKRAMRFARARELPSASLFAEAGAPHPASGTLQPGWFSFPSRSRPLHFVRVACRNNTERAPGCTPPVLRPALGRRMSASMGSTPSPTPPPPPPFAAAHSPQERCCPCSFGCSLSGSSLLPRGPSGCCSLS